MTHCPLCNKTIDSYCESSHKEPFAHHNPFEGLQIYGPYSMDKGVLCQSEDYIHFETSTGENRLVKLGVEDPVNAWDSSFDDEDDYPFDDDDDFEWDIDGYDEDDDF